MYHSVEIIWYLLTLSPVIVLSIRTNAVRSKAKESEKSWNIVAKFIV
jgi:hypothetical protein